MPKRMIETSFTEEDLKIENTLRPRFLKDYTGQEKIKTNLKIFIEAAKGRGESLDHALFYGPPGLGKTSTSWSRPWEQSSGRILTSLPRARRSTGSITARWN